MRGNQGALGVIFSPDELENLGAIAADLRRSNRSVTALKLPGGSNTPQDLAADGASNLGQLMRLARLHGQHSIGMSIGASLGSTFGPVGAIVGGFLGHAAGVKIAAFKNAGFSRVDQILKEAMLNPDLAGALLKRASQMPERGSAVALAHALRRSATALPASANIATSHNRAGGSPASWGAIPIQ